MTSSDQTTGVDNIEVSNEIEIVESFDDLNLNENLLRLKFLHSFWVYFHIFYTGFECDLTSFPLVSSVI